MAVNKSRIRKWVKALRSGEYVQGQGVLVEEDSGKDYDFFCCLGVATDIYVLETGDAKVWDTNGLLDKKVQYWYGFSNNNPDLYYGGLSFVAMLNDGKQFNFDQIADAIERTYL